MLILLAPKESWWKAVCVFGATQRRGCELQELEAWEQPNRSNIKSEKPVWKQFVSMTDDVPDIIVWWYKGKSARQSKETGITIECR